MMPDLNYRALIAGLTDELRGEMAYTALLHADENAVSHLVDALYAGVGEAHGLIIIELLATIGGWEARKLLEDILSPFKPFKHEAWKQAAHEGMRKNGWDESPSD